MNKDCKITENLNIESKEKEIDLDSSLESLGFPEDGYFPLVDRWIEDSLPSIQSRVIIEDLAQKSDFEGMMEMGVPERLVPIVSRWACEGPVILTSYSHPEEIDFYKLVGLMNLGLTIRGLRREGIDIPRSRVLEGWYDTVPIKQSAKTPLNLGKIVNCNLSFLDGKNYGLERIENDRLTEIIDDLDFDSSSRQVFNSLQPALITLRKDKKLLESVLGKMDAVSVSMLHEDFRKVIKGSLIDVANLFDGARRDVTHKCCTTTPKVSRLLMQTQKELALQIFFPEWEDRLAVKSIESFLGITNILSSENKRYRNLVMCTLQALQEIYGRSVLKELVSPWEEMFIGVDDEGKIIKMVQTEDNEIIIMDDKTYEAKEKVVCGQEIEIARKYNMTPMSKMEMLALVAGGTTIQMGSEYGMRDRIIKILGIEGRFAQYLTGLRIGKDKEQGNEVFVLEETGKPIPSFLAHIFLGDSLIRDSLIGVIGKTAEPILIPEDRLKTMAIQNFVKSIQRMNRFDGSYGIYS